ncbi:MAG: patatin family protein [Clostridiales bacterium]|nr:patatin family protein [Clostridiales bacterium]
MKLGVTCEGGANRTIFACGAMDALLDLGIYPDYFIGVSAGIADGVSYLSKQKGRNLRILTRFAGDKRYISVRNWLNPRNRAVYGLKFAFEEVPNLHEPFDFETFAAFQGPCLAVVTNLETGQAEYLEVPRHDDAFTLLKASCAMPLMFPAVTYQGQRYLDGGVADPIPFEKAMADGCEKNIVILTREPGYQKKQERLTALVNRRYRRYPLFLDALARRPRVYNQSRVRLFELEKAGRALVILPDNTEGFGRLESDLDKLRALYRHGYDKVMADRARIETYLNT